MKRHSERGSPTNRSVSDRTRDRDTRGCTSAECQHQSNQDEIQEQTGGHDPGSPQGDTTANQPGQATQQIQSGAGNGHGHGHGHEHGQHLSAGGTPPLLAGLFTGAAGYEERRQRLEGINPNGGRMPGTTQQRGPSCRIHALVESPLVAAGLDASILQRITRQFPKQKEIAKRQYPSHMSEDDVPRDVREVATDSFSPGGMYLNNVLTQLNAEGAEAAGANLLGPDLIGTGMILMKLANKKYNENIRDEQLQLAQEPGIPKDVQNAIRENEKIWRKLDKTTLPDNKKFSIANSSDSRQKLAAAFGSNHLFHQRISNRLASIGQQVEQDEEITAAKALLQALLQPRESRHVPDDDNMDRLEQNFITALDSLGGVAQLDSQRWVNIFASKYNNITQAKVGRHALFINGIHDRGGKRYVGVRNSHAYDGFADEIPIRKLLAAYHTPTLDSRPLSKLKRALGVGQEPDGGESGLRLTSVNMSDDIVDKLAKPLPPQSQATPTSQQGGKRPKKEPRSRFLRTKISAFNALSRDAIN